MPLHGDLRSSVLTLVLSFPPLFCCPIAQLTGESLDQAGDEARRVVDFQTEIAKITVPVEELRIPEKLNNPVT